MNMSVMAGVKGQRKNHRVFPGIKGKRPDKAKFRREEAIERQAEYDKLSLQEKLDRLPPEPLCTKQRTRLLGLIEKAKQPKPVKEAPKPQAEETVNNKQPKPKTYMKGQK
jgi:hypothetical protein